MAARSVIAVLLKNMSFRSLGDDILSAVVRSLNDERRAKAIAIEFFDKNSDLSEFIDSGLYERFDAVIGSIPASEGAAVAAWHRLERLKPCVMMFSEPFERSPLRNYVGCNEEAGIGMLVDHLIEEGARSIGYCSFGSESFSVRRFIGFSRGMQRHHHALEQRWINAFDISSGDVFHAHRIRVASANDDERTALRSEIYRSLLRQERLPDAFICDSDQLAFEFADEAARCGIAIPERMMVTGFDNSRIYLGRRPVITSIDQNFGRIARTALVMALDIIGKKRGPYGNEVLVTPRIVIRASTLRRSVLVDTRSEKKLERAMKELLQKHYADRSASNAIAARLGLSPYYFLRRYKAIFGKPFIRAVNEMRLAKAAESLRMTNKSITRIYMENGYTNHIHFNKMFKRAYSMTARQFRGTYKK